MIFFVKRGKELIFCFSGRSFSYKIGVVLKDLIFWMRVSLDFGGSTLDVILWDAKGRIRQTWAYESLDFERASQAEILKHLEVDWGKVEALRVTGGKTYFWDGKFRPVGAKSIAMKRVDEIESIGKGGFYLWQQQYKKNAKKLPILVVSMGTGTCMVKVSQKNRKLKYQHVGGTGVGGGTFLGLTRELLKETDVEKLVKWFKKGRKEKVDLSVKDIVGRNIGIIPADLTASNLGRLAREIEFAPADLAAGIVNLVGQTVAMVAVFAAKSEGVLEVVLTGKLTRIEQVLEVIYKVGRLYGIKFRKPKRAEFGAAVGAGLS